MGLSSTIVAHPWHIATGPAVATIIAGSTRARAQVRDTAQGAWGGKTKGVGQYAEVNGIRLYYETRGTGRPLVLLHGGLGAIEMFGPNLAALANGREVTSPSTCRATGGGRPDRLIEQRVSVACAGPLPALSR